MSVSVVEYLAVGVSAVAAGAVNAVAGGGTLISFPTLVAVGVPSVAANVTNTVALTPGYLGGTIAQRADLEGEARRLRRLLPAAVVGGLVGGALLLATGEELFERLVPFLIYLATGLLAVGDRVKAWVVRHRGEHHAASRTTRWAGVALVGIASVYGGYFGAGLGIILLAVLGLVVDEEFRRVNALKQLVSFTVNVTAAVFFLFSGRVWWGAAIVMMVGSLAGGHLGGTLATRLPPARLRRLVIAIGLVVATVYLVR